MEQKNNNSNSDSDLGEEQKTNLYVSRCCHSTSRIDKRLLIYINKSVVSLILLLWSITQISLHPEKENLLYWIIISMVLSGSAPSILDLKK